MSRSITTGISLFASSLLLSSLRPSINENYTVTLIIWHLHTVFNPHKLGCGTVGIGKEVELHPTVCLSVGEAILVLEVGLKLPGALLADTGGEGVA